jgi:hypothetical protein
LERKAAHQILCVGRQEREIAVGGIEEYEVLDLDVYIATGALNIKA